MRLFNSKTLEYEDLFRRQQAQICDPASNGEVAYEDMLGPRENIANKASYRKIKYVCGEVLRRRLDTLGLITVASIRAGAYDGASIHPFETLFFKTNRGITPRLLEVMIKWIDQTKYSSYDCSMADC